MIALYEQIKTKLETLKDADGSNTFKWIHVWNNQLELIDQSKTYETQYPACFIEFDPQEIRQLGAGYQSFDLLLRFHIIHQLTDAEDGTMEQNLDVFALKTRVFKLIQKFEPPSASMFIRNREIPDHRHGRLYEFTQEYKTEYIENTAAEPIDGKVIDPDTLKLTLSLTVDEVDNPGEPYQIEE
jgi:hypothetical protein